MIQIFTNNPQNELVKFLKESDDYKVTKLSTKPSNYNQNDIKNKKYTNFDASIIRHLKLEMATTISEIDDMIISDFDIVKLRELESYYIQCKLTLKAYIHQDIGKLRTLAKFYHFNLDQLK